MPWENRKEIELEETQVAWFIKYERVHEGSWDLSYYQEPICPGGEQCLGP